MRKFNREIKRLFGIYEKDVPYMVNLKKIVIQPSFLKTHPDKYKMKQKRWYYRHCGEFESHILLTKDYVLKNGYTSYIIAKENNLKKVPVYFVD